jgi:triosephosphate isomerase (TIM)
MRKQIIAGNWKMNCTLAETASLINGLKEALPDATLAREVLLCPPYTSLAIANELIKGTPFRLGAQNVHQEEAGAFTGEISVPMLREAGCEYVIIGHSERRAYYHEDDALINKKVKAALGGGLIVILCVGETLEEREKGVTNDVVQTQLEGSLHGIGQEELQQIIIAYEPVWAIGTGRNATPEQANEVHSYIRRLIADRYTDAVAGDLIIQYGGSVKADNAASLLSMPDIDGALVGGASLKADTFAKIVTAE